MKTREAQEILPPALAQMVIDVGRGYGLNRAAIRHALGDALDFQRAGRWRCPICLGWQGRSNLVIMAMGAGGMAFYMVCPKCERTHKTDEELRAAMAAYVVEGDDR